jgi:D-xylose transport system permease protein
MDDHGRLEQKDGCVMSTADKPIQETPATALSDEELAAVAPEVLANSLGDYGRAWVARIKNGESGALPVIIGLIAICIFFQIERSQFLHANNLVNLFVQATVYILFGAAETWVLLLSEIDLSAGFSAAVAAFTMLELNAAPVSFPWWLAILGGLAVMVLVGALQGMLVAFLGLPSFIVTLGGYLGFTGVMLELANVDKTAVGGVISANGVIADLYNDRISPTAGWIVTIVLIGIYAVIQLLRYRSRVSQGLNAAPLGVTLLGIAGVAAIGIVLMLIFNSNQGLGLTVIKGTPYVIPLVLAVIVVSGLFLSKTRTGRYMYAVGNSPEAARRAGINVKWIVTLGFILCNVTAGLAGLVYASTEGSMSTDFNGGQDVLFAVAAAVIGGTSLFGGRGKIANALLGGLVVAVVFNGLGLMGVSAAVQDMVTAVVLLAAVTLDALVRRRSTVR